MGHVVAWAAYGPGMTTNPGELLRKVQQLDNDVHAIYEMLGGILTQQKRTLDRLDAHDARFTTIESRLDSMDTRLDSMDTRLDSMDTRLDSMDSKLGTLDSKLTEVLARLA